MSDLLLRFSGMTVRYGAVTAVRDVSLDVAVGEIVGLVGPNGAGKTSLLEAAVGLTPYEGSMELAGTSLDRWSPDRRFREGVSLIPEGGGVFPGLSVLENLQLALVGRRGGVASKVPTAHEVMGSAVLERFPRLRERQDIAAGLLSGGERQMLAVARALLPEPKIVLADEPLLGLAPLLREETLALLQEGCRSQGAGCVVTGESTREIAPYCDRTLLLYGGALRESVAAAKDGDK